MHCHPAGQGVRLGRMAGELGAHPILCSLIGGETGAVLGPLLEALPGERRLGFVRSRDADEATRGRCSGRHLAGVLRRIDLEIVERSDGARGFAVLPKRWIVERTISWLNRCRRLAKDWENLNRKALAFLRPASIRLMLRKLCNPS